MKKVSIIIAVFMLAAFCLAIPAAAADEVVNLKDKLGLRGELVITEILSNVKCDSNGKTQGADYCEFFEVMNVSDKEIDMYDYVIWYGGSERANYFYTQAGEWYLAPGEVALVITFTADHVGNVVKNGDSAEPWITYGTDASGNETRTHNTEAWIEFAKTYYAWGQNFLSDAAKDIKVFYTDRTDTSGANNGNSYTLGSGFNCANSGPVDYYVGYRTDESHESAWCMAEVMSASNNRSTTFAPAEGGSINLSIYEFDFGDPTPGYLTQEQKDMWYAADDTTTDVTTEEPPVTTEPPATTEPSVVVTDPATEPSTDATDNGNETEAPSDSKADTTAKPADEGGCKSTIVSSSAILVLAAGAVAVSLRKKHNK